MTTPDQTYAQVKTLVERLKSLSAAKRRVAGMATRYDREGAALYQQTLTLEAP